MGAHSELLQVVLVHRSRLRRAPALKIAHIKDCVRLPPVQFGEVQLLTSTFARLLGGSMCARLLSAAMSATQLRARLERLFSEIQKVVDMARGGVCTSLHVSVAI